MRIDTVPEGGGWRLEVNGRRYGPIMKADGTYHVDGPRGLVVAVKLRNRYPVSVVRAAASVI